MRNEIGDKGASPERLTAYGDVVEHLFKENQKVILS